MKNGRRWLAKIKDKKFKSKGKQLRGNARDKYKPQKDAKLLMEVCWVKTSNCSNLAG